MKNPSFKNTALGLLAGAILMSSCNCPFTPAPAPPSSDLAIELTWDTDADLDLEVWRAPGPLADSRTVRGDTVILPHTDIVTHAEGRAETLRFVPPFDTGIYIVGVRFWAVGPSNARRTRATVRPVNANAMVREFSSVLDDDSADLWLPFRIDAGSRNVVPLNVVANEGI